MTFIDSRNNFNNLYKPNNPINPNIPNIPNNTNNTNNPNIPYKPDNPNTPINPKTFINSNTLRGRLVDGSIGNGDLVERGNGVVFDAIQAG